VILIFLADEFNFLQIAPKNALRSAASIINKPHYFFSGLICSIWTFQRIV